MKPATITKLKKVGNVIIKVASWALVRRNLILKLLPIIGLGTAAATGNLTVIFDIVAQMIVAQ